MDGIRMLIALMAGTSLMLIAAPLPADAQPPKPDAFVSIGAATKETTLAKGTIERTVVTIGNQSNIFLAGVSYTATMAVLGPGEQVVCESHAAFPTLLPNASFGVFQFQVAHPSPITQAMPTQGGQAQRAFPTPIARVHEYKFLTQVSPSKPCPHVDSNCTNNLAVRTVRFPLGVTFSCTRLQ